jgi:hypothetical protein
LSFGLPHLNARPDETGITVIALGFFSGDLNPHFFRYPSFYFYLLAIVYGLYVAGRFVAGAAMEDLLVEIAIDPGNFVLLSRGLSALFGTLTILLVYRLAKRLRDTQTGLAAALLMSLCYLHVRESHFGLLDVTMTFWIILAAEYILRSVRPDSARTGLIAGIFSGIATSTKYAGLFLGFSMAGAWLTSRTATPRFPAIFVEAARSPVLQRYTLGLIGAFLLFTPFALIDVQTFLADVLAESQHLRAGHAGLSDQVGLIYHLRYSLYYGVGLPVLILAIVGTVVALRNHLSTVVALLAFPIVFYLVAGTSKTTFVRYAVPLTPYLCIVAGIGLTYSLDRVRRGLPLAVLIAATLAVASPSLYRIYRMDGLLALQDSRVTAERWITANVTKRSTLVQSGTDWAHLEVRPSRQTLEEWITEARQKGRGGRRLQIRLDRTGTNEGYVLVSHTAAQPIWEKESKPDYAIQHDSPLHVYTPIPSEWKVWIAANYDPVATFEGVGSGKDAWHDQIDAQFLPFAGFEGARRPGPNITIYRRRDQE